MATRRGGPAKKQSSSNGRIRTFEFLPLSIRIETVGGVATPLILRGTPLPATRVQDFSTNADNQEKIQAKILIGESPLSANNVKIGVFDFGGIPPAKKNEPQIKIQFSADSSLKTTVEARIEGTDHSSTQTFDPPVLFTDEAIRELLRSAEQTREADEAKLRSIEARRTALLEVSKAETLLESSTDEKLSKAIATLGLALAAEDSDQIRANTAALQQLIKGHEQAAFFDRLIQASTGKKPAEEEKVSSVSRQPNTTGPRLRCARFLDHKIRN